MGGIVMFAQSGRAHYMREPAAHSMERADTLLLTLRDSGPSPAKLRDGAAWLVHAIREGLAPGILPPTVAPGPGNTLLRSGELEGERDAQLLAGVLADSTFGPLCDVVERLGRWCSTTAETYRTLVGHGVLELENTGLFGPLVSEVLVACATGPTNVAWEFANIRVAQYERFLELFLWRLEHDIEGNTWPGFGDGPGEKAFGGPVVAVRANDEETHNGGQRVLRLDMAGGGRVAYKPRPASGERFFLAPDESLFALLARLSPASGPVRLPVLRSWTGDHPTGPGFTGYSWQEWVEPVPCRGVLRTEGCVRLTGTVLEPRAARRFWHNTGALSAVCFAFGVVDLHGGNVLAGVRRDIAEPFMYPVDLESYFTGGTRLTDTGLVKRFDGWAEHHHVGLETAPRWCSLEGPAACWWRTAEGDLELHRRMASMTRTDTASVVADTDGRTGYGPYLPAMLRGMFDAWTLLDKHRGVIRSYIREQIPRHAVRIIPRRTSEYMAALQDPTSRSGYAPVELAQLDRGDVPYFFRATTGGPVLVMDPPAVAPPDPEVDGREPGCREVELETDNRPAWPPIDEVMGLASVTLQNLGVALKDASRQVFDALDDADLLELDDTESGVRVALLSPDEGQASFDWPERSRRITYVWSRNKVRVRIDELGAPPPDQSASDCGDIRRRLLRLDRVDTVLRAQWTATEFTDTRLEGKLRRLTDAGIEWLADVIGRHGWPGRTLGGARASAAACRLVQHAEGHLEFRRECVELVRTVAEAGDLPLSEVAYLTDALRLAEGRPQLYGTKFERVGSLLEPKPIESPQDVDLRRNALGMEPLSEYSLRLNARFDR